MKIPIYQVDAFVTEKVFSGNPAAVCILTEWLSDELLQNIAMENNLAETAFIVKIENRYEIRWFTPTVEVDLCGHATLASAHVIFNYESYNGIEIEFYSNRSGQLLVKKDGDMLTLNFPTDDMMQLDSQSINGLNIQPVEIWKGKTDYMLVYHSEEDVVNVIPDFKLLNELNARGVIITAKGNNVDFVSRFFAPQSGIDEDPVTGSAHTSLTPYWSKELKKSLLTGKQLSKRQGLIHCLDLKSRVELSGHSRLFLKGEIIVE